MANAQIKFLNKRVALKNLLVREILRVTSQYQGNFLSSHEVMGSMSTNSVVQLRLALNNYSASGFAEPASHIGSLCAELAQQGHLRHGQKICPILNRTDDAFAA